MKRMGRDFFIKFSLFATVIMTLIVSMNLVDLLNKYVDSSLNISVGSEYEFQKLCKIQYTGEDLWNQNRGVTNDELAENINNIKKMLLEFLNDLPQFNCNITVPNVYMKLNDGIDVSSTVIISFNEKLPYEIEHISNDQLGVYIGNSYNGYWTGSNLKLDMQSYEISGIIKSYYLNLDNSVLVPYSCMDETSKDTLLNSLATYILYESSFPIFFSSNSSGIIEKDIELMNKYVANDGNFIVTDGTSDDENNIEEDKNDIPLIYRLIRNIICIISGLFCFIAVYEVLRLFFNIKKNNIAILWSLGSKKRIIYGKLIKELLPAIILGFISAYIIEWMIYFNTMNYSFRAVLRNGFIASVSVLLIAFIMMAVTINNMLKKSKINERVD